ncbi:helix-turn-helix domain-containing protein [Sulfuriferula sp. GW1]|uniref:helix-turn-helix domain-containing protein n=1 Tax=Sulfuriferula sp. GW1 TaxID=3345111 RepID=UPI0039AFCE4E
MKNEDKQPYTPPEQGIAERIRLERAKVGDGLSVEDLSRVCKEFDPEAKGISRAALFRYESGKILPGARELRILCDALGVSPNWLLRGKESDRLSKSDYAMIEQMKNWTRETANSDINDFVLGHTPKNDLVRNERIKKAIEKKPKR